MCRLFIFRTLLALIFTVTLSTASWSSPFVFKLDTPQQERNKQDEKAGNKAAQTQKAEPEKLDIKEVPKSKKQSRPKVVSKPNVKVKSIKVVRPKIKKP